MDGCAALFRRRGGGVVSSTPEPLMGLSSVRRRPDAGGARFAPDA